MPGSSNLPPTEAPEPGVLPQAREPVLFAQAESKPPTSWTGVNAEAALMAIVTSQRVQEATGLDRQGLLRRFSQQWTADSALTDCQFFAMSLIFKN